MKRKISYFFVTFVITILLTNSVYATRMASAIGTVNHSYNGGTAISTTGILSDATSYWEDAGYTNIIDITDPSYITLLSNLVGAEVLLLTTHGNEDSMIFKSNVGIVTGDDRILGAYEYIGLNTVKNAWDQNLLLIMYMGCSTASPGTDGTYANSITYKSVADANAEVAIGFEDEVSASDMEKWAELFNYYLSIGNGVEDSARYANNNINNYNSENIKEWLLVYNTTPNQKIGRYYSNVDLASIEESYIRNTYQASNLLDETVNLTNNSNTEIVNEIKKIDKSIEEKDYEIARSKSRIMDVNTNQIREIENVDINFKVGDFYTDSGYTLEIENNKIIGMYEKNMNSEMKNMFNNDSEEFKREAYNNELLEILNTLQNTNLSTITYLNQENDEIKLYYDTKNNKKYCQVKVRDEIIDANGNKGVFVDFINYEID